MVQAAAKVSDINVYNSLLVMHMIEIIRFCTAGAHSWHQRKPSADHSSSKSAGDEPFVTDVSAALNNRYDSP
jgi:hypothetical protein